MMTSGMTTLFLKEPHDATFTRVESRGSITLHDLNELYSISSVLECDGSGNVQPRTMVIDTPGSVLHRGHHYIVRRDVAQSGKENRVTFQQRVVVKEFAVQQQQQQQSGGVSETPVVDPVASLLEPDMSVVFDVSGESILSQQLQQVPKTTQPPAPSAPPAPLAALPGGDSICLVGQCSDEDLSFLSHPSALRERGGITHVYFPFVETKPRTGELVNMTWGKVQEMLDRDHGPQWEGQHAEAMSAIAEAEALLSVSGNVS